MAEATATNSLSKAQKAALVFLLLEEKGAASLFEKMSDYEIREICNTLLKMREIPVGDLTLVMSEFYQDVFKKNQGPVTGEMVMNQVLGKSLPEERGRVLLEDIKGGKGDRRNPLEGLMESLAPEQIYRMVKDEHPQTLAVILSLIKPKISREVISLFDETAQVDLLHRMAVLSKVPEDILKVMEAQFKSKLSGPATGAEEQQAKQAIDVPGADLVLKYLKAQPWDKADAKITLIESQNAELGQTLRKKFFTLEDMMRSDDNGMRNLLKSIETAQLSIALKMAIPEVQDKFFSNMSTRAATILKEDIEVMREPKPEEIEAATNSILEQAKKLITEGQMILSSLS